MSLLLDESTAKKAVEMVLPAIMRAIAALTFKRRHLHIVICDPAFLPSDATPEWQWRNNGIVYQHSLQDDDEWEHPYDTIALSKTYLSWRYGMPTQILQSRCPHLLTSGDTIYFGSAVCDGLVVGVSGVQPWFDQMVAAWVLEACRALCINARETGEMSNDGDFVT